ncbi:MAG: hypothetical protein ACK4RV_13535 [Caulobacter sp.]|jgi:hypothetical protein
MDRISDRNLALVSVALGACAAIGLWMGLSDSLRRSAPEWEGGSQTPVQQTAGPPEAKPVDARTLVETAPPPVKAAPKAVEPEEEPEETAAAEAAAPPPVQTAAAPAPDITQRTPATPPGKAPPAKAPAAKAPAPKTPAADPIGDLVQEKTSQPPPEIPF